jgi:hypothetical protein
MSFVAGALTPPAPTPSTYPDYLTVTPQKSDGSLRLVAPAGYSAFLFGPPTRMTGPTRYLLMITTEAMVWDLVGFSFYQTRNQQARPERPPYNPQLWQFSAAVGDDQKVELHVIQPWDGAAPPTPGNRTLTPVDAIETLLVSANPGRLEDASNGHSWKSRDVSIVVRAVQQVSMPTLFGNGATTQTILSHGSMPLCNAVASPDQQNGLTGGLVTFDQTRKLFAVDFSWTSDKNAELLRITDVPVKFE